RQTKTTTTKNPHRCAGVDKVTPYQPLREACHAAIGSVFVTHYPGCRLSSKCFGLSSGCHPNVLACHSERSEESPHFARNSAELQGTTTTNRTQPPHPLESSLHAQHPTRHPRRHPRNPRLHPRTRRLRTRARLCRRHPC